MSAACRSRPDSAPAPAWGKTTRRRCGVNGPENHWARAVAGGGVVANFPDLLNPECADCRRCRAWATLARYGAGLFHRAALWGVAAGAPVRVRGAASGRLTARRPGERLWWGDFSSALREDLDSR